MQPQFKDTHDMIKAREGIMRGIDRAANEVLPTLGPIGLMAVIEFPGLDPVEADDGITILKSLDFKNPLEQIGLMKLRKSSARTSEEGKDGTATTAALTKALTRAALNEAGTDRSKVREVRERLQAGLADIIKQLEAMKRPTTLTDVERIAKTSSLDPEVSKIISDMISKIGPDGSIEVVKGAELGYKSEVVNGAQFDGGSVSTYFLNRETEECVLEKPWIALIDRKISLGVQVKSIMDSVAKSDSKSILFIADDVDGLGLASLAQASKYVTVINSQTNQAQTGTFDVCCVRNPYTASPARDFLLDMCALTGATLISEESGMKMSEATTALLGRADRVVVSGIGKGGKTRIIGCAKTPALKSRADAIRAEIASSTSEYQKSMLRERLARIDGGMGVIRVGCYTDTEFNAKKYKFNNAINAAQSALKEGMLPGGGSALMKVVASDLMFKDVLDFPFKKMAENAGVKWYEHVGDVATKPNIGVDFISKKQVDMFEAGIVDSFKVTRLALESAASTAMSVVSYGTAITIAKEEKSKE